MLLIAYQSRFLVCGGVPYALLLERYGCRLVTADVYRTIRNEDTNRVSLNVLSFSCQIVSTHSHIDSGYVLVTYILVTDSFDLPERPHPYSAVHIA